MLVVCMLYVLGGKGLQWPRVAQHEPLMRIEPHLAVSKTGLTQQFIKPVRSEFVTAFGVNTFTLAELPPSPIAPAHSHIAACFQMHFHPRTGGIIKTAMTPIGQHEVTAQQTIDMQQHITVERSRHT